MCSHLSRNMLRLHCLHDILWDLVAEALQGVVDRSLISQIIHDHTISPTVAEGKTGSPYAVTL